MGIPPYYGASGTGIIFYNGYNISIQNNTIYDGYSGIGLYYSTAILQNNTIHDSNGFGLTISYSTGIVMKNNILSNIKYSFRIFGNSIEYYNHSIDETNIFNNNKVYFIINGNNLNIPIDAGYIGLINCTNITIHNKIFTKNNNGIDIAFSNNITLNNVNIHDNYNGIFIRSSSNILINNSIISDNDYGGLYVYYSNNITVNNSEIKNNWYYGMQFTGTYNVNITRNEFNNNSHSLSIFYRSEDFHVYKNTFINNNYCGITGYYGNKNIFVHSNNFINNYLHFYDNYATITFYLNEIGNYWDNYHGNDDGSNGRIADDGIGDTDLPYNGVDNYPLIGPHVNFGSNIQIPINENITLIFDNVTTEGQIIYSVSNDGPPIPSGFNLSSIYFNISAKFEFSGPINISFSYDQIALNISEDNLRLYHFNSTSESWEDITTYIDVNNNTIYGITQNFSIFALLTENIQYSIDGLIKLTENMNIRNGISNSLDSKLDNAKKSLSSLNSGKRSDAINHLEAFIKEVRAQIGKSISNDDSIKLIDFTEKIIEAINRGDY